MTRKPVVKVTTLGRFCVHVRGEPLAFGRKMPLRPLALLKYLAANGGEIADARAAEALWPGKGPGALRPLAINVHRLRRLVGSSEAVIHSDRHIAIDLRTVWCDALSFERMLDLAAGSGRDAERTRLTARALALYRGDFLAGESREDWIVAARERLRARYVLACTAQGERFAAVGHWEEARACFQRGLEADELAEDPCLGLMACYAAMRQPVAGLAVYRRFAHALAHRSGAEPAPAARALYDRLSSQSAARRNRARAA